MKHQLTVVWGDWASQNAGKVPIEQLKEEGRVQTLEFDTADEAYAYWQGVEDTAGWLGARVFDGGQEVLEP